MTKIERKKKECPDEIDNDEMICQKVEKEYPEQLLNNWKKC